MKQVITLFRNSDFLISFSRKFPVFGFLIQKIAGRFIYPLVNLKGILSGYRSYVYDSDYVDESKFQEPHIVSFLEDQVSKNMIFFDIGAHFGYYTLLSHKLIGKGGRIIAFEPSPIPFDFLKRNIGINKIKNIKIENLLVGNDNDQHLFYHSGLGGTMSSIKPSNNLPLSIKIFSTTLDYYCEKNKLYPDFIKIDVEGAELLVIKGMNKILQRKNLKILIELHKPQLSQQKINSLYYILRKSGFRILNILPKKNGYNLKESRLPKELKHHIFAIK